jgi:predicted nucleic acid-binding protein
MTLVDTSVWIDHLRRPDQDLAILLEAEQVLMHPLVLGELSLGNLHHREKVLKHFGYFETATIVSDVMVGELVRRHHLWGKGLGWVDCHLMASARKANANLVTRDKALRAAWLVVRKG